MSVEREAADHLLAALRASAAQSGLAEAEDVELLWMLVGELEQRGDPRVTAVVTLCDRYDGPD